VSAIDVVYTAPDAARGAPNKPVTTGLVLDIWDSVEHVKQWLGHDFVAGALRNHNHDGVNSAGIPVGPNLLRNGSFEDDLAGWTETVFSGGTVAISSTTRHHGAKSLAITSTSTANGGGNALIDEFIPVGVDERIQWECYLSASVANVSSRLEAIWYDGDQSQISAVNLINLTNTPTSATLEQNWIAAPSTARFMRLLATGGVPGAGSATGTVFFDGLALRGQRNTATVVVRKTANQVTTSTSFIDASDLNFPVGPGEIWCFEAHLVGQADTSNSHPQWAINGPASPTSFRMTAMQVRSNDDVTESAIVVTAYNSGTATGTGSSGTGVLTRMSGALVNGANAGLLQVRFRRGGGTGGANALANSFLVGWRIQ
jgi:hypothetical protein